MTITMLHDLEPLKVKGQFLLGHLLNAKKDGVYFYLKMKEQHGDAMQLRFGHQSLYLFLNPDYNREILVDKADQFIKGKQYDPLRILLGNGLLTSIGKDWSKQRRMLNPLFNKEGLDVLLIHIDRISQKYANKISLNQEMNWTKYMFDYTLEVAFASFFGTSFNEEELNRLVQASLICVRFVSRRMSNPINFPFILPLNDHRQFRKAYKVLKREVEKIYDERLIMKVSTSNDLLDLLMKAEDLENPHQKLTKAEIWDQILSFMIAGHETTAVTMSWLFHHLAKDKLIQEKIANECKENNFQFESSLSLSQYPYLSAVINEVLRMYPAGWILARTAIADSMIGEFKIKKGQVLAVSPIITQRDPRWWEKPDEFIPERFLEGHPLKNKAPKNAFIPFSIGKRNCIGSRFAQIEIALFCISFFKSKRLTANQDIVLMKGFVTLKSKEAIRVTVHEIL
jgi:cytochrome P450